MALDFDYPTSYDKLIEPGTNKASDDFVRWWNTHIDSLVGYLTQFGIKLPILTTVQRDSIINPINGLTIYNSTIDAPQIYQAGAWKTFTTF
jgi:hypothetical protein